MALSRLASALVLGMIALPRPIAVADDAGIVDVQALPPAVREAAETAAPGATWQRVKRKADGGKSTYEFKGMTSSGQAIEVEIEVDPAGTARAVQAETDLRGGPATPTAPPSAKGGGGWSYLWGIGIGLLAILGLFLKAIFDGVLKSVGATIAKGMGSERLGEAIGERIFRGRPGDKGGPNAHDPAGAMDTAEGDDEPEHS